MRSRQGFTLIELMVAMALTLFIMVILSQAFIISLNLFSGLKGIGDMQMNLRTALNLLRDDLSQDHFEGKRRLSDPDLTSVRPREGFFAIYQGAATLSEFVDADNIPSTRSTGTVLHFAVKKRGNRRESFFTGRILGNHAGFQGYDYLNTSEAEETAFVANITPVTNPPTAPKTFSSPWAEVAYYMVQSGTTAEPNNPASPIGTPLFSLYRAQLVVLPAPGVRGGPRGANAASYNAGFLANFQDLSCAAQVIAKANVVHFFSPSDLALGNRTLVPATLPAGGNARGVALLMSNVISFDVKVLHTIASDFLPISNVVGGPGPWTFDSLTTANTLQGVQISIRIWDPRSSQARQATLVQDL
jgi:prepilin-type N-terminal cleavage/methylation domain-containing protein